MVPTFRSGFISMLAHQFKHKGKHDPFAGIIQIKFDRVISERDPHIQGISTFRAKRLDAKE